MKKQLVICCFAILTLNVRSQVYNAGSILAGYENIVPDTLLYYVVTPYTHNTYSINLFGNQLKDVELAAHGAVSSGGSSTYIRIQSLDPDVYIRFGRWDSVYVPGSSSWSVTKVAKPLNAGDQINSSGAIWDNSLLYLTDHTGTGGGIKNVNDWVGGDKYLGLKYQNGSAIYYGWIRVECISKDSCYIKEFSSSSIFSSVNEIMADHSILFPNPFKESFDIMSVNSDLLEIQEIKLINMYSEEVAVSCEVRADRMRLCPVSEIPDGCYFLQIPLKKGGLFSRKIMKFSN